MLQRELERWPGVDMELDFATKKHPRVTFRCGGQQRKMFFSGSPSCCHANKNILLQTRRILKDLGARAVD